MIALQVSSHRGQPDDSFGPDVNLSKGGRPRSALSGLAKDKAPECTVQGQRGEEGTEGPARTA
jgi:hypothetical protein